MSEQPFSGVGHTETPKERATRLDAEFLLDFVSRDLGAFKRYVSGFVNLILIGLIVLIAVDVFRIYTNVQVVQQCVARSIPTLQQ